MALVLARRAGESFEIGNHVKITVESVRGSQVRFTVDAPRSIRVHRSEIAKRVRADNNGVIPGQEAT